MIYEINLALVYSVFNMHELFEISTFVIMLSVQIVVSYPTEKRPQSRPLKRFYDNMKP